MTGVEMAGIALAVVPLCLYVLEHHEAELRPWKALIKYRVQYRRSVDDLGICLVDLELTIRNVFIDAELADDDQDFNTLVHAYNPKNDADHKAKLVACFGRSAYEHGFETKLRHIQDSVSKISSVLGLEDLSSQTHDHVSSPFLAICLLPRMPIGATSVLTGLRRESGPGSRRSSINDVPMTVQLPPHKRKRFSNRERKSFWAA
jgi:hypothetical protein